MKRDILFINIVVIFSMVIGLGMFSFAAEEIEVIQQEEASISAPIPHPKQQLKEELKLKLSKAQPFFFSEEE